jgi:hypothetical protein
LFLIVLIEFDFYCYLKVPLIDPFILFLFVQDCHYRIDLI